MSSSAMHPCTGSSEMDRREFVTAAAVLISAAPTLAPEKSAAAAASASEAKAWIAELESARRKLDGVPGLLQAGEWDQVRTILKTPPVNFLWNMGDSKNPLSQLAKATDQFELIDLKEEISISLQMTDQYTYDNVFVYFQPGNGKVKIKEPMEMALKAMQQIDDALQLAKDSL